VKLHEKSTYSTHCCKDNWFRIPSALHKEDYTMFLTSCQECLDTRECLDTPVKKQKLDRRPRKNFDEELIAWKNDHLVLEYYGLPNNYFLPFCYGNDDDGRRRR
jgi:hypothetical protein